ncbi:potassium channel regulatory protein-like [Saccoglossus kowalevskii]|uniref:Potassium channel regulatory protein-like n=1 Tax=Saccoglossus kowalevskii TaxID=10224 RepID=A0ABM0LWU9_SACKO|nr:PREDICTED: potassium channel regulatory protein-like [Saccoglossus kowalevskii]
MLEPISCVVGGKVFIISANLLEKCQGTRLAALLECTDRSADSAGDNATQLSERNSELFHLILEFLELGVLSLSPTYKDLEKLEDEAVYYGIHALVEAVRQRKEELETEALAATSYVPPYDTRLKCVEYVSFSSY